MPTYAYRCADCGHAFDIYQSFSDDALTECPECGGALRKVFGSSLGVTFNGSGFYRTDSRAGSSGSSSSGSSS
ncbi:FmdB family zinc ribbon protein [Leucobacter chromiireducens]|uniref:FmdB family zinc ribbon protein n=1 Tax=Leucobacter chromiireducens TaxID=283877 RepID=UPI000F6339F3|nr:FmdB family zinc ribbon protein [Leucobacter chromiireducens]